MSTQELPNRIYVAIQVVVAVFFLVVCWKAAKNKVDRDYKNKDK